MTIYTTFDKTIQERKEFYNVSSAKKWMRERIKMGHDVTGSKTKLWANGEWEPMGKIKLNGINKVFIANAGMTKANY